MSDKSKTEIDYAQIRNDVASQVGSGLMGYIEEQRPPVVRVSPERLRACQRVSAALFADESLTILSACVAEGVTRGSYTYVRDAGLI